MAVLRRLAALVLVALVCAPAAALAAPPAGPSAGPSATTASAARADTGPTDIFTGSIVFRFPQRPAAPQAQLFRIRVDEVIKGDVEPGTAAVLTRQAAFRSCDAAQLKVDPERLFLFQLTADGEALLASRCGDVMEATPLLLREIRQAVQAEEEQANPPAPPAEPDPVEFRDVTASEPRPFGRTAAPGLAILIVGVLGLLLAGRISRRR